MKLLFLLISVLTVNNLQSQITFESHLITDNALRVSSVIANDINGDGKIDIISASLGDDKIVWYENDGFNGFNIEHIVANDVDGAHSVKAKDMDNDGDIDIIAAGAFDSDIYWYENVDGLGNFNSQHLITNLAEFTLSIYVDDIDGDGYNDVLSTSITEDRIDWFENIDGNGTFGPQQIITNWQTIRADGASSVFVIDIDGDGDNDVLSASWHDNKIAWYENADGQGNFNSQQIITGIANSANFVFAVDIDGDGDNDVLSASQNDNKIAWYENIDGQGDFSSQQIITTNADNAYSVFAIDLDGDGDIDVLSASEDDNKIAWYENIDGQGGFGVQQIISSSAMQARSVFAIDIDNDGDIDVLSGSYDDNKVVLFENQGVLNLNQNILLNFTIYPVPTENILNIKSKTKIIKIEIYSKLGQLILKNTTENKIDISNLAQGLYFVKVRDVNGNFGVKKIVKR